MFATFDIVKTVRPLPLLSQTFAAGTRFVVFSVHEDRFGWCLNVGPVGASEPAAFNVPVSVFERVE